MSQPGQHLLAVSRKVEI